MISKAWHSWDLASPAEQIDHTSDEAQRQTIRASIPFTTMLPSPYVNKKGSTEAPGVRFSPIIMP